MFLTKSMSKLLAKLLILLMFITNPACIVAVHAATSSENTATNQDAMVTTMTVDKSTTGQVATGVLAKDNEHVSNQEKALQFSNRMLNDYLTTSRGKGPNWLKTTEIQFLFTENHKPTYSIETLQPFGMLKDDTSLWFWQGRYAHTSPSSSTANLGIGWRKLSADKSSMIGFNSFYDYGFEYNLARIGLGTEYFNKQAEYRMNYYYPVSADRQTGVSYLDSGVLTSYIRAVEGLDFEAGTSFTHMPELKVYAGGYYWDNKYHGDEKGYRLRSTLQLNPRVNMELGYLHSNLTSSVYGKIRYELAFDSISTLPGSKLKKDKRDIISKSNDVSSKLLQKVERENDIKTETYTKFVAYTGNIKTTVTNSTNSTPIVGAVVQVYQNGSAIGSAVTTDASGTALFSGLTVGMYTVEASYGGYTKTNTINLTKDKTADKPAEVDLSLAVVGGNAMVTVVNTTGEAVSGATVTATLVSTTIAKAEKSIIDRILGIQSAYAATSFTVPLTTDAYGVVNFTNLPSGMYQFLVTKNGKSMQSQQLAVNSNSTSSERVILPDSGGDVIVTVKDGNSAVVSGASVTISLSGGSATTMTTGSDGIVNFSGLAAGTYTVSVAKEGYTGNTVSTIVTNGITTTVTIPLVIQTNNITASVTGTGGTITPVGDTAVIYNGTQTYTITADSVHRIASIIVDGTTVPITATGIGGSQSYTFGSVTGGHTIVATFVTAYSITASVNGTGGTISPAGTSVVTGGAEQTYTIVADATHQITSITVDGTTVPVTTTSLGGSQTYQFSNVGGGHSIVATFTTAYTITASVTGTGGSISPAGITAVTNGANQTYTIAADATHQITSITVDGTTVPVTTTSLGGSQTYQFSNVSGGHSIVATFTTAYTVTASITGTGGSISPAGDSFLPSGADKSYTITADATHQIESITVDGIPIPVTVTALGGSQIYTFSNVTSSHQIIVSFCSAYTITASVTGTGGTISPAGIAVVTSGANPIYTITADALHGIASITVDGTTSIPVTNSNPGGSQTYQFSNVSSSHSIAVTFYGTFTVTGRVNGTGGTVANTNSTRDDNGVNLTFTITADATHQIGSIIVDETTSVPITNTQLGGVQTYQFTSIIGTHSIVASFDIAYPITATVTGTGGSVTPAGTTLIKIGNSQTYTISADPNYQIASITVNGNTVIPISNLNLGATQTFTFNNVHSADSINATFSRPNFAMTLTAGANGSIRKDATAVTTDSITCGDNATYDIVANPYYKIASISVDGTPQNVTGTSSQTISLNNVTGTHTIAATFCYDVATIQNETLSQLGGQYAFSMVANTAQNTLTITNTNGWTGAVCIVEASNSASIPLTYRYVALNQTYVYDLSALVSEGYSVPWRLSLD